jgi:hypothetical protein
VALFKTEMPILSQVGLHKLLWCQERAEVVGSDVESILGLEDTEEEE